MGKKKLGGPVPFEIRDALVEVVVGTADEGVRVRKLAVEIFPFLHVLDLNVHGEAFGYEVDLVPEALDEQAIMAYSLIHVIESAVDSLESSVVSI